MADERDPKLSQRYRELPGEEPSRELDQAILAAAHRAADKPHAPLVVPAGRHRWYFSLAAAAILVLAVAVTVHVERLQPDAELAVPPAPAPAPAPEVPGAPVPKPEPKARQEARRAYTPDPSPSAPAASPAADARLAEERAMAEHAAKEARDVQLRKQQAAAQGSAEVAASAQPRQRADSAASSSAPAAAQYSAVIPERELERIAELRSQGRDDEADRALEEFRKRYPDYQISREMRAKVERKPAR